MSENDSHERLRRMRSGGTWQEDNLIFLRNATRDPLRMIVGTCRLLLHEEFGELSEDQSKAVEGIIKYTESVERAIDLHLETQGIIVGQSSGKQD
jgi:hypothetical protein